MSIKNIGPNKWQFRVRALVHGKMKCKKQIVTGTRDQARYAEVQAKQALYFDKRRSLTIKTLHEALEFYRNNTTADLSRVDSLLNRLDRDLGPVRIVDLSEKFGQYWISLKTERAQRTGALLSNVTRNRLLVYAKTAIQLCIKRGFLDKNPLQGFSKLPEEGRDRVLTEDEEQRIINVMENYGQIFPDSPYTRSYLLPAFLFSLKNPIRRGDLQALTKENLDMFKPWIHFYASKTRKRKPRETCLPFLDETLLSWFKRLPAGCPYLFPRIDAEGNWHALGDFKKHWDAVLDAAKVRDFHWHDLKHCAITWMLDGAYTERDLRNLGIQYSPAMVNRYYHTDANKVLAKWKTAQGTPAKSQKTAV